MIHLLWCTLRPNVFTSSHNYWMNNAKNIENIKTHVLLDSDSDAVSIEKYLENYNHRIVIYKPPYVGVCLPSYKLSSTTDTKDGDIIVFARDDFSCPRGWDEYLISQFSDKSGVLFVRDGYQNPDSSNMISPAITIPIMDSSAFNAMNKTIYHPAFHHMFSDCELYLTAKELGLLIDNRVNDTTTFEHHHHSPGKRSADQFDVEYVKNWGNDEVTWNQRKNIPVEERIKVNL